MSSDLTGAGRGADGPVVLLSDPHVAADPADVVRGVNMADRLRRVVTRVLAGPRPGLVLVNGDLAQERGLPGDYARLAELLAPLAGAGLPVAVTLGNHDHRGRFRAAGAAEGLFEVVEGDGPGEAAERGGEALRCGRLEAAGADWYLLDSLRETGEIPGELGAAQRGWLASRLDAVPDRPAFVVTHHPPEDPDDPEDDGFGLADSVELMELLKPRQQVKAVFHGHRHRFGVRTVEGLHVVGLAATGFVFEDGQHPGYCEARLVDGRLELTRRAVEAGGPADGEVLRLALR